MTSCGDDAASTSSAADAALEDVRALDDGTPGAESSAQELSAEAASLASLDATDAEKVGSALVDGADPLNGPDCTTPIDAAAWSADTGTLEADAETPGADSGTPTLARDAADESPAAEADPSPVPDAEAECNAVANVGALVTVTVHGPSETRTPATGGAIVDGVYALTAIDCYPGVDGYCNTEPQARTAVLEVSGTTVDAQVVLVTDQGMGRESRHYTVSGTSLSGMVTCPVVENGSVEFSVTQTGLLIFEGASWFTFVRE